MPVKKDQLESGSYTYGASTIEILSWDPEAQISIGKFCSIAKNVRVILGGNHHTDRISTYPFGFRRMDVFNKAVLPPPPGKGVSIGNDVWIGYGVTIMDGTMIGDGSVVAANSHVVGSIEPYSIVGGNPARLIHYRFNETVRKTLLELRWWDLTEEEINEISPILCGGDVGELCVWYRSRGKL